MVNSLEPGAAGGVEASLRRTFQPGTGSQKYSLSVNPSSRGRAWLAKCQSSWSTSSWFHLRSGMVFLLGSQARAAGPLHQSTPVRPPARGPGKEGSDVSSDCGSGRLGRVCLAIRVLPVRVIPDAGTGGGGVRAGQIGQQVADLGQQ